jgi:hypothetical protein
MMIKSVLLPLTPAEAFKLFTEAISAWWPADRRHTGDEASTLFLQADGRFFERARNGDEIDLGRVVEWQPRERIVLDFYLATGPAHPTQVDIAFVPEGDGTRVTVTHGPKPESLDLWDDRAPRYARSWEVVLAAMRSACTSSRSCYQ